MLSLTPAWWTSRASVFQFGFFKIVEFPPEGEVIQRKHYKGFWFNWEIEMPVFGCAYNFGSNKKYIIGVDTGSPDGNSTVISSKDDKGIITIEEIK